MTTSLSSQQDRVRKTQLAPWQAAALRAPYPHFVFYGGVGVGKSYTGSHFAILHFLHHPEKTGFIGANNYDQLTTATLKELFYWLDYYGFEYEIDRIPPDHWGPRQTLKTYRNVLSVRVGGRVACAYTKVVSEPDAWRGIEISWYWFDELRDTQEYAHDMILGRCRETDYVRGLMTTTTNGESWDYKRVCGPHRDRSLFGSMHIPTKLAVQHGILTDKYYQTMAKTYSPLMAEQELEARHVNVLGGKAYYAANQDNSKRRAPWGADRPDPSRPLIVGLDFNFFPAPCVWVVGQIGPDMWGSDGTYWGECIHWFGELSDTQVSTPEMAWKLLNQYPGFFYRIFGDASGQRGSTSNAGETDYIQLSTTLSDEGAMFSIDVEQANPMVKNRVETMNAMFRNGMGEVRQTYDPEGCPLLDGDVRTVGWKTNALGKGALDNNGDVQRTHSSDGAGYAVFKLFPISGRATILESIPSAIREAM